MVDAWFLLLGFLLAGYFVLGGYDYGVQMLAPVLARDERSRRVALNALGPFFLSNEVWLVAFLGVLFGAFPVLEGTLLSGLYPVFLVLLLALVVGTTAVQLRGRLAVSRSRRVFDVLACAGGAVAAGSWGVVVGVLLRGVPQGPGAGLVLDAASVLDPFVGVCAVVAVLLFAAHGAMFLALRANGDLAARAVRAGSVLVPATAAGTVLACVVAVADGVTVAHPAIALTVAGVLGVAGPLVALVLLRRGVHGVAFAVSCLAAAAPVAVLGLAHYPTVLASSVDPRFSLSVTAVAADGGTLGMLALFGVVLVPVILGYQVWNWWAFRGRVDDRAPSYF